MHVTDATDENVIGKALRQARDRKGWTLRELAQAVDLSESYIWRIEKGQRHPGPDTIARLCQVLDLDPSELGVDEVPEVPRGKLSGHSQGELGSVLDVSTAVWRDPRLTTKQKEIVLSIYRSYVEG